MIDITTAYLNQLFLEISLWFLDFGMSSTHLQTSNISSSNLPTEYMKSTFLISS